MKAHNVYIVNLEKRIDRKEFCQSQFSGREEMCFEFIPAVDHPVGAIGLWQTIRQILTNKIQPEHEYFICCEDDHQFTQFYSSDFLATSIADANSKGADILLGGVSWFDTGIQVSDHLFWIERFSGLQFAVIFRKLFPKILAAEFEKGEYADLKIAALAERKFVIYPFISVQKEFGYSDVTHNNEQKGRVERLFLEASEQFEILDTVRAYYQKQ